MSGKKNDNWLIFQTIFFVVIFAGLLGWDKFLSIIKMLLTKTWEPLWSYFGRDMTIGYSIYFAVVILLFGVGIILTKKTKKKIYFYISGILNLLGLVGMYLAYK